MKSRAALSVCLLLAMPPQLRMARSPFCGRSFYDYA